MSTASPFVGVPSAGTITSSPPVAAGEVQASLAEALFHERVSGARDEIPATAFLIAVGALSLGWVLRNSIPVDELYTWVTLQAAFAASCLWVAHAYRADKNRVARAGL